MAKKPNLAQRSIQKFIKFYQAWSATRNPSCRFIPTCSKYCAESIERHGVLRGGYHSIKRLCKCHPLGSWGYDPPVARNLKGQE